MKFILVLSFLSFYSELNFNVVTDRYFDTREECEDHEIYINTVELDVSMMCIEQGDIESFTREIPTLDFSQISLPK
tara:strand:- start:307 stop:534 length:228 start_codon:yes stop_codon:yes gene_type:complete